MSFILFNLIVFLFAVSAQGAPNVVSFEARKGFEQEFVVKICIGELGKGSAKGSRLQLKDKKYYLLKIDDYQANAKDIVYLKKWKYSFSSGAGSFFYDFSKHRESSFVVDAANYGGLSIEPSALCSKK